MWNLQREHCDKYTKKYAAGNTFYLKEMQYCCVHGETDLFLFPDFDEKHGNCQEAEETRKLECAVNNFNGKIRQTIDVRVYAKSAVNKFRAARGIL